MKLFRSIILSVSVVAFLFSCNDDEPVTAGFTADVTAIKTGETVTFTNTSENANYYQWDFGDNGISYAENPSHTYNSKGTYVVTLVAVGDDNADTATDTITVSVDNATIYEGEGIDGVDLYDTWSDIESTYGTDTTYTLYEYTSGSYTYYYKYVYYEDEGLEFLFLSLSETLYSDDEVYAIYIYSPYSGSTSEGIAIGSTYDEMVDAYGEPEDEYEYTGYGYTGYWYDSRGIDFYVTNSSEEVFCICIYEATSTTSSSQASTEKSRAIQNIIQKYSYFNMVNKR